MARTEEYDISRSPAKNRFAGIWRLATGFRAIYLTAAACVGASALGKTASFYLIRYFIDDVLADPARSGGIASATTSTITSSA